MTSQEQWEKLQARWREAMEKARGFRRALDYKYGERWHAPRGMQEKLDRLHAQEEKAQERIFAWLDQHSPRQWRTGCPCYWICDQLTYADAITHGALSVTVPVAYGYFPSDAIRFSMALEKAAA